MTAAKVDLWLPANRHGGGTRLGDHAALGGAGTYFTRQLRVWSDRAQIQGVADEMRRAGSAYRGCPRNGPMSAIATAAFTAVEALNTLRAASASGLGQQVSPSPPPILGEPEGSRTSGAAFSI
jgi:hypothetical protein